MKFTRRYLRITGNNRGAAAVEFAIVGILFFTLLFGIVDYALMGFVNLTMQHAVREGTRYAITGQDGLAGAWDGTKDSRYLMDKRFRAMIEKIKDQSMGFFGKVLNPDGGIQVQDIDGHDIKRDFSYDFNGDGDTDDTDETWQAYVPGYHGDIIVVKLNCTWPLLTPLMSPFFPDGKYNFTVASTMKNEEFDPVY